MGDRGLKSHAYAFGYDPVILIGDREQRVAADQLLGGVVAKDVGVPLIDVDELVVLDNVDAGDRLLDQAAQRLVEIDHFLRVAFVRGDVFDRRNRMIKLTGDLA